MYIEFKITTWERIHVPDESIEKMKDSLLLDRIESSSDVYDVDENCTLEILDEVSTQMTVKDNKGESTIEAYDEYGELIYKNGK